MTKIVIKPFALLVFAPILAFSAIEHDKNITELPDAMSNFDGKKEDTRSESQNIIRAASYGKQTVYDSDEDMAGKLELERQMREAEKNKDNNKTDNNKTKEETDKEKELAALMKKFNLVSGADKNETLFYNETLLNWTRMAKNSNPRGAEVASAKGTFVVAVKADTNSTKTSSNKDGETVVVKGYCYITENIEVGKQPGALRTECQTNVGAITMFANLVNVNKQSSLIVDPKYIERQGVRYDVKSSIVTNETKTSYNVATFVNDTKVAQIGWTALGAGAEEVKTVSNEYLKAIEESKTKEETVPLTTTDSQGNVAQTLVSQTNTEPPDPLDYLTKSVINLSMSALKNTADIYKKDLPYLYYISAETKIWIDLKVNKKGEYVK